MSKDAGYGHPPEWTRFRKGQSGNPKGRPPKAANKKQPLAPPFTADNPSLALQHKILNQKIQIRVGGKIKKMTVEEANHRGLVNSALKGNGPNIRELAKRSDRLGDLAARHAVLAREEAAEEFARAAAWKDDMRRIWEAAAKSGSEPAHPWPHPDDILLDADNLTFRIRGPQSVDGSCPMAWCSFAAAATTISG